MNLHITPSFKIDRLCKTASVLLFLVLYWKYQYSRLGCSGSLTTIIFVTYLKVALLEFYLFQEKDKFFLSWTNISFCKKLLAFILDCTFQQHDLFGYFRFSLGSFGPYWGSSQNIFKNLPNGLLISNCNVFQKYLLFVRAIGINYQKNRQKGHFTHGSI